MPYEIPDGSLLEATVKGSLAGQVTMSVFHYKLTNTFGVPDGEATINSFHTEWGGNFDFFGAYKECCSNELTFTELVYQWIYPIRYRRVTKPLVGQAGTIVETSEPPNVAQVVTKVGERAGRHYVGTVHIPGLPKANNGNGLLVEQQLTLLTTFGGLVATAAQNGTLVPVIFNRSQPQDSPRIIDAFPQSTVRIMRRRTVGLGI